MGNSAVFASAFLLLIAISYVSATQFHLGQARRVQKRDVYVECDPKDKYRSFDGQCNNLENRMWGSINQPFTRFISNDYDDGLGEPRTKGVNNDELPLAREVSVKAMPPNNATDEVTLMTMQWGQFLDHDIGLTAEVLDAEGHHVECQCDNTDEVCFPIKVEDDDEFFQGRECLEFTRSQGLSLQNSEGKTVREQINLLTPFIDASQVYGVTKQQSDNLRDRDANGDLLHTLKTTKRGKRGDLLPKDANAGCILEADRPDDFCFLAGDGRVNEMPGLIGMHTIFVLEHNRIANRIKNRRPAWDSERIFQETRRIVGAMVQHITYNEYLPTVMSSDARQRFRIDIDDCFHYKPDLSPQLFNAFPTAVFRFGHSQIPEEVTQGAVTVPLRDLFSRPQTIFQRFNGVITALRNDMSSRSDGNFAHSITRHLVLGRGMPETDLVARNIQRGRDHGIPSFNEFRAKCGLGKVSDFHEINPDMPKDILKHLKKLYNKNVDDVDLFVGGMMEKRVEGSLLGPTFNCLMGEQFKRLRHGDRFFYQHNIRKTANNPAFGFTRAERRQIERITLAKIICRNSNARRVQEDIFRPVDPDTNPRVPCGRIKGFVLRPFLREH